MDYLTLDDGLHLAYQLDGAADGPPLVFANSLGTDLHLWDGQVAGLGTQFRIMRYDMRGHGQSGIPASPATVERLGADLLALLDHLAIPRAHVCGLSLGGMTALWLAARHPARVDRLVLANAAARIGSSAGWDARIAAVRAGGMAAVRDVVIGRFLSADFRAREPDVTRAFGDTLVALDPDGYIAACAALRDTDLHPLLPAVRAPTVIVGGTLDESTPPRQANELHAVLARSALLMLPAAHLSNVEQPAAFNAALLAFLGPPASC